MKVLGRWKAAFSALVLTFALATGSFVSVMAAEDEVPKQRLQVAPAILEIDDLKPGETTTETFKVQNTGSEVLKYSVSAAPYNVNVSDDKYTSDYSRETTYNDIVKWITFSKENGEVQPGEQDEVTVTIKVPSNAPAAGQYAAILVRMVNEKTSEESAVNTVNQVALVVYSNVAGTTRKSGEVLENKVPSFMFNPPIQATSVIENKGNVHFTASYILQVYPFFGGEEVFTNEEHPDTQVIMPETRRLNTITWDNAPHLGIFKVKQTIKYLDQESVSEKVLFICPIWFLLIILVVIFLAIFLIVSRVRGRKE